MAIPVLLEIAMIAHWQLQLDVAHATHTSSAGIFTFYLNEPSLTGDSVGMLLWQGDLLDGDGPLHENLGPGLTKIRRAYKR